LRLGNARLRLIGLSRDVLYINAGKDISLTKAIARLKRKVNDASADPCGQGCLVNRTDRP